MNCIDCRFNSKNEMCSCGTREQIKKTKMIPVNFICDTKILNKYVGIKDNTFRQNKVKEWFAS